MATMTDFERVKFYYTRKWATKDQVGQYTYYGTITKDEYKLIIGEDYTGKTLAEEREEAAQTAQAEEPVTE